MLKDYHVHLENLSFVLFPLLIFGGGRTNGEDDYDVQFGWSIRFKDQPTIAMVEKTEGARGYILKRRSHGKSRNGLKFFPPLPSFLVVRRRKWPY